MYACTFTCFQPSRCPTKKSLNIQTIGQFQVRCPNYLIHTHLCTLPRLKRTQWNIVRTRPSHSRTTGLFVVLDLVPDRPGGAHIRVQQQLRVCPVLELGEREQRPQRDPAAAPVQLVDKKFIGRQVYVAEPVV